MPLSLGATEQNRGDNVSGNSGLAALAEEVGKLSSFVQYVQKPGNSLTVRRLNPQSFEKSSSMVAQLFFRAVLGTVSRAPNVRCQASLRTGIHPPAATRTFLSVADLSSLRKATTNYVLSSIKESLTV